MADNTKDVTLQIRARDFSQKTLDEVTASLGDMVKAQAAQVEGAKKGEVSAKALEAAYTKLEQAAQQLAKQNAVINTFNAQSQAYDDATAKAESLRQKQTDLAKSMAGLESPTKAQNKALADLTKQAGAAETAQQRLLDRLNTTSARLKSYGIDTADVGTAQKNIVQYVGLANTALENQNNLIESADGLLKNHRAQLAATASANAELAAQEKALADFQSSIAAQREKESGARSGAVDKLRELSQQAQYNQMLAEQAAQEKALGAAESQRNAFETAMSSQRERERAIELQLIEDQERERTSLMQLGVQLTANTEKYAQMAEVQSSQKKFNLGGDLKDLADPAGAALKTIDGVSTSVDELAARAAALKGPVTEAAAALKTLTAAQNGAINIGKQIDEYQRQLIVMKEAREAYLQANTAVKELAASLNEGTTSTGVLSQIAGAEAKLKSASMAMQEQSARAKELRENLESIGVDTGNLGASEERLVGIVTSATAATNQYTAAVEKYGKARADGSSSLDKYNDGERTTLGFVQRLKGEVLGLAAAYVGVQGAIGLAKDTLDTVTQSAAIQSRFSIAFAGDQGKVQDALAYTRKLSDQLGVSNLTAADSYSRLAASAKNSTMSMKDIQFIFEGLTKAASQSGVSTDAYGRALVQVEQVIGKGKLNADDFRQIASDFPALPAAIAKGLGTTETALREFMKEGEVTANVLINGIKQLDQDSAAGFDASVVALQQATGRLQTAKSDFELALAKGGFEDAYIDFIKQLATLLQGEQGQKLAGQLSTALKGIVTVLQFVIDHFQSLELILEGLAFAKVVSGFLGLQKAIGVAVVALDAYAASQAVVTTATAAADTAMVEQVAALVAVEAGAAGTATTMGVAATATTAMSVAARGLAVALGLVSGALALAVAGFGAYIVAKEILDKTGGTDKIGDLGIYDATHTAIDMNGPGYYAAHPSLRPPDQPAYNPTPRDASTAKPAADATPGVPSVEDGLKLTDIYYAAIAKQQAEDQKKLDQQSREARARSAKDELADRIAIAQETTLKSRADITSKFQNGSGQLGAAQNATALAVNQQQLDEIAATETTKFNNEQLKKRQDTAQKIEDLVRKTGEEIAVIQAANDQKLTALDPAADYEKRVAARLATVEKQFKTIKDQIAELARLDPAKAKQVQTATDALRPAADKAATEAAGEDELVRLQTQLNELTTARTNELALQKSMLESSVVTYDQYVTNVEAINTKYSGSIKTAIQNVRQFATVVKSIQNDPGKAAGLNARLDTADANNNPDKQNAQEQLTASETQVNALLSARQSMIDDINSKKKLGLITDGQSADQQNEINQLFKQNILDAGKAINDYIDTLEKFTSDPAVLAALEAQRAKMQQIQDTTVKNQKVFSDYETTMINGTADVATNGLQNLITQLVKVQQGQESLGDAAKSVATSVVLAFAQMAEQAALYIIKLQIIKSLQGFGSFGASGAAGAGSGATAVDGSAGDAAIAADVAHSGGIMSMANRSTRSVSMSLFAGAQRLHSGGMPGVDASEVPTILKKNEEVITRNDPRHVLNGGKDADSGGGQMTNQRIVLVTDERDIHAAMSSAQGEQVTIRNIKKNIPTIRALLNK